MQIPEADILLFSDKLLKCLTKKQREILIMLYRNRSETDENGKRLTQKQIAGRLKMTTPRLSQQKKIILKHARNLLFDKK